MISTLTLFNMGAIVGTVIVVTLLIYGIIVLYKVQEERSKIDDIIKDKLDNRLWDIPVELQCQYCKATVPIDFSLETTHFTCPRCGGRNKVMVQFITVTTDNYSKSNEDGGN